MNVNTPLVEALETLRFRLEETLKGAEAEEHLRTLLKSRTIDGDTTEEAAKKAGLSVSTTLRLLNKLEAEGFEADDGSTLSKGEGEAGKNRGQGPGGRQPKKFIWLFM